MHLSANGSLAGEALDLDLCEAHNTSFGGVNSEVAAHESARTCEFSLTNLTNEDFAFVHFLATKTLHTKALAG